ncbi:MAG: DUF499 domain-containing protein [Deltaproteobacteria bacterium]|nr:DUF499 domain-containing protein [Deltaproteobacteria bacterium]
MTTLNAPDATENALRRYFVLPDEVSKIGFVHKINQEATPDEVFKTVSEYQVTPSIQQNLDRALGYANKSLADHASTFTWVHGSFGCGKSHFMNVLSLMMAGELAVYQEHPELQKQKQKYEDGVLKKKLFRLHVHCISRGTNSDPLEKIVFGAAVDAVKRLHPDAGLPALFQWQALFEAAKGVRKGMGDEAFFKTISPGSEAKTGENIEGDNDEEAWGKLSTKGTWTAERFDKAIKDAATPEGEALLKALTASKMLGKVAEGSGFIAIGPGLKALASFLKDLGYDGVVLFLDELVLWLSTLRGDKDKLNEQTKRVVTLVEHGDFRPAIPFVTFAARQRALSEMMGTFAEGEGEKVFEDQLSYWKDRFEVINLEDKDLPRIIEKRILKPKSESTKAELDAAFDGFQQRFKKDFRKLTGDQGDVDDFRRVYPFSPALIEVLVALSASLQRDRTALRELSRMMVEYLSDFQPGKVIPVGDLFDVVVHGDVSDKAAMRRLFSNASRIYKDELLPLIQESNNTSRDGRCQLQSDEFDDSLGCSGCQEQSCRAQTRIAKTVLLQGLVPNTPVLKHLDAQTLVNLNAGSVKSVVPNQESSQVASMLRVWAGESSAIFIQDKDGPNPTVKAVLETIDTRRIIESALEYDNQQRRQGRVRNILFSMMGIQTKGQDAYRNVEWSGRKWKIGVVYTNTRITNEATFRCADNEDLRLIIDYPFDDAGHGPEDDEKSIAQAMITHRRASTLWYGCPVL